MRIRVRECGSAKRGAIPGLFESAKREAIPGLFVNLHTINEEKP